MSKSNSGPPPKRGLTLDFNSSQPSTKRARLGVTPGGGAPPILTTPDVQMLKLSSPELAKFLNNAQGGTTPTPSGYLFPKTVTEEQEIYAKGFEEALHRMHQQKQEPEAATQVPSETAISTIEKATAAHAKNLVAASTSAGSNLVMAANAIADQPPLPVNLPRASTSTESTSEPATAALSISSRPLSRPSSGASGSIDSSDSYLLPEGVKVKQEEADHDDEDSEDYEPSPGGSKVSPINMEAQEKIKLERKRMRNRVAATKCRKRKLERIAQLDEKVKALKGENVELAAVVKKLKEAVCNLKQEVMDHMSNGCEIMNPDMTAV